VEQSDNSPGMPDAKPSPLLQALAVEIKARRAALGISQEELAHRAELSRTFVAKIETGQNQPTVTVLFKLAVALAATPGELVHAVADRLAREERATRRKARIPVPR
jgi:transcriptional regulator with XRE-family HTH domain